MRIPASNKNNIMKRTHELVKNSEQNRYEFDLDGKKAVIEYLERPGVVILTHTEVPQSLEGQGIGSELVLSVLEEIDGKGLKVVPMCGFVARYIRRHPEWEQLVFENAAQ